MNNWEREHVIVRRITYSYWNRWMLCFNLKSNSWGFTEIGRIKKLCCIALECLKAVR